MKITFIAELRAEAEENGARGVILHLPAEFAPSAVRNSKPKQNVLRTIGAQKTDDARLTVQVGIEMADEIVALKVPQQPRHAWKRSATKGCVAFSAPLSGVGDVDIIVRTQQSSPSRCS